MTHKQGGGGRRPHGVRKHNDDGGMCMVWQVANGIHKLLLKRTTTIRHTPPPVLHDEGPKPSLGQSIVSLAHAI